jgi:histidine triad (HIT) family protein
MSDDCIFCKIASKQIPVDPLYEDDEFIAFRDAQPHAPVHALVIPKQHVPTIVDMDDPGLLGRLMAAALEVARRTGVSEDGFRTVINCRDDGGQTVYHVHVHVMGGRFMSWPPG